MDKPLSFDDIAGSDELCEHCDLYKKIRICEGVSCTEAYERYLEDFEEEEYE